MAEPSSDRFPAEHTHWRRRAEFLTFLVLAFGIWPIIAVGFVGSYGFAVWMWQIVFGPPGPPSH